MMGSIWGINTSIARVHALLIASEHALSLDDISNRLRISRGNASMCLRELRNWSIARLVKEPGDRQDYYVTEPDVWRMFFAILRERKRREFDPILAMVRETFSQLRAGSGGTVETRLQQMEELLGTLNLLAERFLADEDKARRALSLLSNFSNEKKG
jgi:DNA-binding transcriptional regulator GbsR (MarR family)